MKGRRTIAYFQIDKNPNKILTTEEDFLRFAESLYRSALDYSHIVEICISKTRYSTALFSIAAFASELFLKSIVSIRLQKKWMGHDLYDIYDILPEDDKEYIKQTHPCSNIKRMDFELELKETGKAFEVLRYHHEKKDLAFNAVFILEFMTTVRAFCQQSLKELETDGKPTPPLTTACCQNVAN